MPVSLILDQASVKCGFAVIDTSESHYDANRNIQPGKLIQHGLITGSGSDPIRRIYEIGTGLRQVVRDYQVSEIVIEQQFYGSFASAKTTKAMAVVEFLIDVVASENNLPEPYSQAIGTIKRVAGEKGDASKPQVEKGACEFWGLDRGQIFDNNHSDALGGAMSWAIQGGLFRQKRVDKNSFKQKKLNFAGR